MPPIKPVIRRRHSIAAAISGLAIGVAGVGAAALPATADPGDGGGAPPFSAIAGDASPTGAHSVTLLTGDRVTVTDLSDGTHAVSIEPVDPGATIQTVEVDGDLHVLPQSVMPYLVNGVVDGDLFNVSQLIEFGYDDASVDATPVILELDDAALSSRSVPLVGIELGITLESVGGSAATAGHASAAATWAALTAAPTSDADRADAPGAVSLGGGVEAIHLDGKVQATLDSSVPYIGAPRAWAEGYTGDGVTVAVLDSGYDDSHPDLAGRVLPESMSFVPGEEVADDPKGHGTHVASTIAGTGEASGGIHRGVADGADVLVGKVLDAKGSGQDSWVISGMQWAAERAGIVSMSLGTSQASDGTDLMATALNEISASTGALFVVAAGNASAPESVGSPGSAASALTVGSVDDPTSALSSFSSQGPLARSGALKPDIVGPGSNVTAARSADSAGSGSYVGMSGTSMATPHVAGAAAIVKQQHPDYTAAQLRAALTSTATDVGLTAYQAGAGVVNVAGAVDKTVLASGSGDFGMLSWGATVEPIVRSIDYTNRGDEEVVLSLAADLVDTTPGAGNNAERTAPTSPVAASDMLTLDVTELTVPAGETRTVTLTADPAKVPTGAQLSGALIATVGDGEVTRTALGLVTESERYDLTVTATDFDGAPLNTYGSLWSSTTKQFMPFSVQGKTTLRLPAGLYSVMSYMEVDRTPDSQAIVLVGDPGLVLDGATEVAFDARATKPVTVDVDDDDVQSVIRRMDYSVDGFGGAALAPTVIDELYAQPMDAPDAENFDFTTRWRLQQPLLTLKAGRESLDLIVQPGSTLLDGDLRATAVDVGAGSVTEFAAATVKGKVAVATRSDEVSAPMRTANALAAGAALLLTVNDADGELNEWVGSEDYLSESGIPVAAISGVQGRQLLESIAKRTVKVRAVGTPLATDVYDIARYSAGSVPADLDYEPAALARLDTQYYGDGGLVSEFRYDFVPGVEFVSGFQMRTERGVKRTEWVNTDQIRWYQDATAIDAAWNVRDTLRSFEPGQRVKSGFFGPIVRPNVGPGYWAPYRSGDQASVNLPAWADGANPLRTGDLDLFAGTDERAQRIEVYVDGNLLSTSTSQATYVEGIPDGDSEWRIVNTASHNGMHIESSRQTSTEWTFHSNGTTADGTPQVLPLIQAFYNVDLGDDGTVGAGRKKGKPVAFGLELGHLAGAAGAAELTAATLEVRVADGDWQPVDLEVSSADTTDETRDFVTGYTAKLKVPDAGAWIDLRVSATDAAGTTFSQEITHAFEVAPAQKGGHHGDRG